MTTLSTTVVSTDTTVNELDFSLNSFNQQKVYTGALAYAHKIKNLLFMRPGDLPSMPDAGINIQSYRFKSMDLLLSGTLKENISNQITKYVTNISTDQIVITATKYENDYFLVIEIALYETVKIIYAVQQNKGELINFNFKIYDNEPVEIW